MPVAAFAQPSVEWTSYKLVITSTFANYGGVQFGRTIGYESDIRQVLIMVNDTGMNRKSLIVVLNWDRTCRALDQLAHLLGHSRWQGR